MNPAGISHETLLSEIESLRSKLAQSEEELAESREVIAAIRSGEVDALVVSGAAGDQIFTLRGAEYAYRALVEAMNEGAATLAADGTVLYCNQHLSELLGVSLEQMIGRPFRFLADDPAHSLFKTLFDRALDDASARAEVQLLATNGRIIPAHISLSKMKIEEPTAVCMVVTDLTESKKWEELVSAGRLTASILESSAEGIAVCDGKGKIISVNEALKRLRGADPTYEFFDAAFPLHIDGASVSPLLFSIPSALAGAIRSLEVNFQRADGKTFFLLLSSGKIAGDSGTAGCVLTLTDITERKRTQQALIQSEKLAAVGRLASSIAHEINNPLEAVTNLLYIARISDEIPAIRKYLEGADRELRRVSAITTQTLRFHKQSTNPTEITCQQLLDDVLTIYQGRILNSNVRVQKRKRANTPIHCFEGEIRQVISNLIGNAVDAMQGNGGRLLLRSYEAHDFAGRKGVVITVADDGAGMSQETSTRAFEAFFTTKGASGTGLGLWISKEIIDRHRGVLSIRSSQRVGKTGTVVRLFLPSASEGR